MKRYLQIFLFWIVMIALLPGSLLAQSASSYGFQALSTTFTPITGGTSLSIQSDDVVSGIMPIGFTFVFCGTPYTNYRISSNGWLTFNTAVSASNAGNSLAGLNNIRPGLQWLWDDINGANGTASYLVTGTAPNRVLTIQMLNWRWNWSSTPPNISIQIKLYETTNVIEYIYRQEAGAGNPAGSSGASIGICDNLPTTTYLSLNNASPTATASSTIFTTNINTRPVNGQLFRFVPPNPCNSSTVFPSSAATLIPRDTVCIGSATTADFQPSGLMPAVTGLSYQLQTSANATGPWTNVGAPNASPTGFPVAPTASSYFRIQLLCTGTPTTLASTPKFIYVENPNTPVVADTTICGGGNVLLSTLSPGNAVWYPSLTASVPSFTGNNATAFVQNTTTFYVAHGANPTLQNVDVGLGANSSSFSASTPFFGAWGGYKHEYLITQAELAAFGIFPGNAIFGWGVQVWSGSGSYNGFQVSMGTTAATALNTVFQTGTTVVFPSTNVSVTTGVNMFDFPTPYIYTGGNLVIQTCWSNNNVFNSYCYTVDDNTSYTSTHYNYGDNQLPASICAFVSGGITNSVRPKFTFKVLSSCEGARVPMTVTVSELPVVDLGPDSEKCTDEGYLELLNARNPGSSYIWDNGFTGQVRVIDSTGNYWVRVENTGGCVASDTVNIVFRPKPVSQLGNDTTVCEEQALLLDAGAGGTRYYWSNGATTRTTTVRNAGTYFVVITGANDCITIDTMVVNQNGLIPTHRGIRVQNLSPSSFRFALTNPQNVSSLSWDFGDGSPLSFGVSPTHTYNAPGNYVVTVFASSSCGSINDTTTVHIQSSTNIDEIPLSEDIKAYPIPATDYLNVSLVKQTPILSAVIVDISGKLQEQISDINATNVRLDTSALPSGTYFVLVTTEKGIYRKKIDIVR